MSLLSGDILTADDEGEDPLFFSEFIFQLTGIYTAVAKYTPFDF